MGKTVLEHITVNGKPLVTYVAEELKKEVDEVREKEIRKVSVGTGYVAPQSKFGNTSGSRSQHYDTVKTMSDEVKMHLNYLNEMGGMVTVNEFLSKPQAPQGSIESVLKEHEEKVKFYLREQQRIQIELSRHQAVVDSLKTTLDILTGKAPITTMGSSSEDTNGSSGKYRQRASRTNWFPIVETCLADGPLSRRDLREKMRILAPDTQDQLLYATIAKFLRMGRVKDQEGKIHWVPVEN